MTLTRPVAATRQSEVRDRERERQAENRHRRNRVELLALPFCRTCGGVATGTDPRLLADIDDTDELWCVCAVRTSALQRRLLQIAHAHHDPDDTSLTDRLAP